MIQSTLGKTDLTWIEQTAAQNQVYLTCILDLVVNQATSFKKKKKHTQLECQMDYTVKFKVVLWPFIITFTKEKKEMEITRKLLSKLSFLKLWNKNTLNAIIVYTKNSWFNFQKKTISIYIHQTLSHRPHNPHISQLVTMFFWKDLINSN